MKKILISAYAVSPIRGSECAVGWEICTGLANYFDVTVLYCKITPSKDNYNKEINDFIIKNGSIDNISFIPVSMPKSSIKYTKLHDMGLWPAYYWGYNLWQKEVYNKAKTLQKSENFDAVYQLNMIGFREPGYLWKLKIPFFWGPTNGFHSVPFSFISSFNGSEFVFQILKHISNEIQIKFNTRPKNAAKKAKLVWAVDYIAYKNLKQWGGNVELLQETGLKILPKKSNFKSFDGKSPLKIVWSGLINTGKALQILIEALIKVKDLNFKLTVIGDGPLKPEMIKLSSPISKKIEWTGLLAKNDAINLVSKSDILIHTSLKEGTPHSVLEALGMGIPVICHDTCGMGIVVNDKNGFKIPYINRTISVSSIENLLKEIIENPEILNNKYKKIFEDIENLTWDNKIKKISQKINSLL